MAENTTPPTGDAGFTLAGVFATVAATIPDSECLVQGDRRLTYAQVDARATGLARFLAGQGLGAHTPRAGLANHESGQDHVGILMRNGPEYIESLIGGWRARVAPFNINYRYTGAELRQVLADSGARALVYASEFAPAVAELREELPDLEVLVQVEDHSQQPLLPGAYAYEDALEAPDPPGGLPTPSPDDLYILYTGGTTGAPKGVLWRQHDIFLAAMGGTPFGSSESYGSYDEVAAAAREGAGGITMMMVAPFMHGGAQWSTFFTMTTGARIVMPRTVTRLDAAEVLRTVIDEGVVSMPVMGDAMARPLVAEMETGRYDLSGLVALSNGAAPLTPAVRDRLHAAVPHAMILDAGGASETGIQMGTMSAPGSESEPAVFDPHPGTLVLDEQCTRVLEPGGGEGWLARRGLIPLGYLNDPDKTAATFPVIDGARYSLPGDRARVRDDGRVELLGRDSATINSGGEKIFAEEVERALAMHPGVHDVIVVGRPSEQWGSEVVALVAADDAVSDDDLLAECRRQLAGFKTPKALLRLPELQRSPSGKADYRWARAQVTGG